MEVKRWVMLLQASSTKIERHIKIRGVANPFDPKDVHTSNNEVPSNKAGEQVAPLD
jgi:hypothetical protein